MNRCEHFYKDKIVVITGAGGYIGGQLVSALQKLQANIIRISSQDLPTFDKVTSLKRDIKSGDFWSEIVAKADIIFHLAGNTSVYSAIDNPLESLTSSVVPIIELCNAAKVRKRQIKVVFASTVTVYGLKDAIEFPISEMSLVNPVSLYDLHKLFAEEQLLFASKKGVLDGVCLRLANVYGPSINTALSSDRGVLNKVTKFALEGKNLQLFGGGNFIRDYIYIDDVIDAFLLAGLTEEMKDRSYIVASGIGITVEKAFQMVVKKVEAKTGQKVNIKNVPFPDGADPTEMRNFIGNISSIMNACGWKPEVTLDEGINKLIGSLL